MKTRLRDGDSDLYVPGGMPVVRASLILYRKRGDISNAHDHNHGE